MQLLAAVLVALGATEGAAPVPPDDAVFRPGEAGYACFRAPSLTYTADGRRLLAIVEAYHYHCVSREWCDIVQKVSTDGGHTFSAVELVHGTGRDGGNTSSPCFQNVSPTLDPTTGELFLPFHADYYAAGSPIVAGTATLLVSSTDGGGSYSAARDVSAAFAHGVPSMPGGTTLPSGRLIVPVYRPGTCPSGKKVAAAGRQFCSYLVLSDTHGRSWRAGAEAANGSECQAATLANGSVLLNMRDSSPAPGSLSEEPPLHATSSARVASRGGGLGARRMARSDDGGVGQHEHF